MIDPLRAQIGISRIACLATDVIMLAKSSILELVEIANGVAIAAAVREIAPPIGRGCQPPPAQPHVHEIALWSQAAMACED